MERIIATNPFTGRSSELVLTKRSEFCVDANWSIEPKFALSGHLGSSPEHQVKFVEKMCSNPDATLAKWHHLKNLGLPVVPTMRRVKDGGVLMTDLTKGGGKLFGKYRYYRDDGHPEDDVNKIFAAIKPESVSKCVMKLAEDASIAKVILAEDDPFEVLVHPDCTWQLIILDLTKVIANPTVTKEKILEKNLSTVGWFLEMLDGIREEIKSGIPKSHDYGFDLDLI